jgi:hypothetical protein
MSTDSEKQWRIDNARHLRGLQLKFQPYVRWSDNWDHDHCSACWATFAQFDGPDVQHAGYATCDDYPKGARYDWVCSTCFAELQEDMQWFTKPNPGDTPRE